RFVLTHLQLRPWEVGDVQPSVLQYCLALSKIGCDLKLEIPGKRSADDRPCFVDVEGAADVLVVTAGKEPAIALKHSPESDPVVIIGSRKAEPLLACLDNRHFKLLGSLRFSLNLLDLVLRLEFVTDHFDALVQPLQRINSTLELLD